MASILVIDDDASVREVIADLMKLNGHVVTEAQNGREGMEVIRRIQPDLVILDMKMPVMDGSQVLRAVREDDSLRLTPIIVLTGAGDSEHMVQSLEGGANDYIEKPFKPQELIARANVQLRIVKLERDLQASETRHRTLFERSADPMVLLNDQGLIIQANNAFVTMLSLRAEELLNASILRFVTPLGRPEFEAAIIGALEGSRIPIFESLLVPLEGWSLPVDVDIHPIELQDRRHVLLHVRDIRWRKATHAWSTMILERIGDSVFVADGQGLILLASRSAADLTGYSRTDLIGLDFVRLQPPEFARRWHEEFLVQMRDGEPASYEGLLRRKDESMVHVEWTVSMFWVESEEYLIGVARDLTDRKVLEMQVRQAQKMEAVGRLAGGIAHEFNNLLQVITGYSELILSRAPEGSSEQHQAGEIRQAGRKAATLTRHLLAFSRKQVLQPEELDLNALILGTEKILRQMLDHSIDLVLTLRPGVGRVRVDPGQIEQVLLALAANAGEAMPGGGRLSIETQDTVIDREYAEGHPEVQPGPHVMVTVRDTGSGMPPETLAVLFEPFFTTKEQGQGTGLGLAMAYGTVRQSGGSILVSSRPGEGTEFRLLFPTASKSREEPIMVEAAGAPAPSGKETVLLVDDETMVCDLVGKVLQSLGYTVLLSNSGPQALDILRSHPDPIHLLVTDVMMPGMTGRELFEKARSESPNLKAVFVSGYTEDEVIREGALEKGLAFLQKPFSGPALAAKVRALLDEGR